MRHLVSPLRATIAACGLLASSAAALADPVTYAGTLDGSAIVVEFTEDPAMSGAAPGGRYFYRSQGIDIPLTSRPSVTGTIVLSEEAACPPGDCSDDSEPAEAAIWRLTAAGNGATLSGHWEGPKSLPIELKRAGRRPVGNDRATPRGLYDFSEALTYAGDDAPITAELSPYDALRFETPLDAGERHDMTNAAFRYVTDPRTRFRYPRIIEAAGTDIASANRLLEDYHRKTSLLAFGCAALRYAGLRNGEGTGRNLAGIDESHVDVDYLSPTLMSWTVSGDVYCFGSHPDNSVTTYLMDVRRGAILSPGDLFAGWADAPPDNLAAFVRQRRARPTDQESIDSETECETDDLVARYLGIRVEPGQRGASIVFTLNDVPHAITACGTDLVTLPVAELRRFMTPRAAELFPDELAGAN